MISINKKIFILCSCITIIIVSLSLFNVISYYSVDNQIIESTTYTDNSNLISVYIEDEDGNYVLSETTNFDQGTDYVYNEEKSYCVNESVLSYNTDTSKISVTASGTDNCYVYFDANNDIPVLLSVDYFGVTSGLGGTGNFYNFELDNSYDISYIEVDGILYDVDEEFACKLESTEGINYQIRVLTSSGIYSSYLNVTVYCTRGYLNYFTTADGDEFENKISIIHDYSITSAELEELGIDTANDIYIPIVFDNYSILDEITFPITITMDVTGVIPDMEVFILYYIDGAWTIIEYVTVGVGTVTFTINSF